VALLQVRRSPAIFFGLYLSIFLSGRQGLPAQNFTATTQVPKYYRPDSGLKVRRTASTSECWTCQYRRHFRNLAVNIKSEIRGA
jgi:hypothetical protein